MKVSVCMATFNGARYLSAQLESLAAQTRLPDELVVNDDASIDETFEVLERFANRAEFHVFAATNQINVGFVQNFELAAKRCTGDLVFFCDQDDVWLREKIELVCQAFQSDPTALLVIHDYQPTNSDLIALNGTHFQMLMKRGRSHLAAMAGASTAVRRELLCLALPFHCEAPHDRWLHELASLAGGKRALPVLLQYFRRHGENASIYGLNSTPWFLRGRPISARKDLRDLLSVKLAARERLESRGVKIPPDGIQTNVVQVRALRARIRVLEANGFPRMFLALRLFVRGGYQSVGGGRAVLRDLLSVEDQE